MQKCNFYCKHYVVLCTGRRQVLIFLFPTSNKNKGLRVKANDILSFNMAYLKTINKADLFECTVEIKN